MGIYMVFKLSQGMLSFRCPWTSHWPFSRQVGGVIIVNPGSCGQPRDYIPGACYAWLDTDNRQVYHGRDKYDLRQVTNILESLGFDRALSDILIRTKGKENQL